MSSVILKNASVEIPIYGFGSHSLKQTILRRAVGGKVAANSSNVIVTAIKDISLSLSDGDAIGLIGHNGSGKTSLLRMIAGVYPPTSGTVEVHGRVSPMFDLSLGMSVDATGIENVRLCGALWGLSRDEIENGIVDVRDFTGLGNYLDIPVRTYSAGMLLRLSFAIATLRQPEILLIDEVIGVGDAVFMNSAVARLTRLASQSRILVVSSHSSDIIRTMCKKVIWLKEGSIAMYGGVNEVLAAYAAQIDAERAYVDPSSIQHVGDLAHA